MNKKKLLYIILLMISIIITGTLAYFTIVTERTALVLTLGEQDEVLVTLEPFEINGTLSSTVSYTSLEDYIQITAENFSAIPKKVLFYYRINSIDSTLISTKLKYSITSSSTIDGTYTEVKTGNFSTAAEGHDLTVYEFDIPANTTIFYRVFTYLDGNENVSSMSGSLIETEFRAEMEHIITPELDEGMIPVKILVDAEAQTVNVVTATNDSTWFDYENHFWANVVLVTEESRSTYLGTTGVTVDVDDILANLVWIPRYEYRHNNLGTSYAGGTQDSPGAITINFIPSYITIPTSSAYKIHPAFTFGDSEVSGFWISKDRVGGTADVPRSNTFNTSSIIEKQSVAFETCLKFNGGTLNNGEVTFVGSNYYGTTSSFDSHMMKGSEFGAVAYLTQSIYGLCSDANTCSAFPRLDNWTTNYGQSDLNAIVSGVGFDFENFKEQVMSVLQYDSNFIYSGNTSGVGGDNSGFVGYINDILYDTSGYVQMPPAKYYDRYTSSNPLTACNGDVCYGHALSELDGWYGHTDNGFVNSSFPWLTFGNDVEAGNLVNGNSSGAASEDGTFRVVILNPNGSSSGSSGGGTGTGGGGATMLIEKANDASITTYSNGDTGEMYTFSQPATTQLGATTDYRYIGSSPNNYITFNDETWRIIGVFGGRIKIIRDTSIGNFIWDLKKSGVGSSLSSYGSNDWVDAQLMYMLNPNDIATNVAKKSGYTFDGTYVKDASGNIIYQKGCKPASASGTSYSCTANSWSLNSTALSQVADVTYYLGGSSSYSGQSTLKHYTDERGENIYNSVRSISWNGKVGLMYASDYGYTFAYGVDNTCYTDPFNCDMSTSLSSWLYNSPVVQWTQTSVYSYYDSVINVTNGSIGNGTVYNEGGIRPVVYLKSDITLTGTGTSGDPYTIVS